MPNKRLPPYEKHTRIGNFDDDVRIDKILRYDDEGKPKKPTTWAQATFDELIDSFEGNERGLLDDVLYNEEITWINVADTTKDTGWKMHIRIDYEEYPKFLKQFLPTLKKYIEGNDIGMKIASLSTAKHHREEDVDFPWVRQQVGKHITIYVPEGKSDVIPYIAAQAGNLIRSGKFPTTYQELKRMGYSNIQYKMKEAILDVDEAVMTGRWSSSFSDSHTNRKDAEAEREDNAYDHIRGYTEREQQWGAINRKTTQLSYDLKREGEYTFNRADVQAMEGKENIPWGARVYFSNVEGESEVYRRAKLLDIGYEEDGSKYAILQIDEEGPLKGAIYKKPVGKISRSSIGRPDYRRLGNYFMIAFSTALLLSLIGTFPNRVPLGMAVSQIGFGPMTLVLSFLSMITIMHLSGRV